MNVLTNRISIRNQIFFSILLFLLLPSLFLFCYMDKPLEREIKDKIGHSAQEALTLAGNNIEYAVENMFASANAIADDPGIVGWLRQPDVISAYDKMQLKYNVLNKITRSNGSAYALVVDRGGQFLASRYTELDMGQRFMSSDWHRSLLRTPEQLLWVFTTDNYTFAERQPIISLAMTIFDYQTHENLGTILYSMPEADMYKYMKGLDGRVYLTDATGTVISGSDKSSFGTKLPSDYASALTDGANRGQVAVGSGADKAIVNYYRISQNGWVIVQAIPYDTVFKEIFANRRRSILAVITIFIVFTLFTFGISNGISRPLELMVRKMTDIENKQFNSPIAVRGPKEIAVLQQAYNQMLGQIKELLTRVREEYVKKEEMRFTALQAQINPHFILNTLNNIKWMAYMRNEREIGQMLSRMAKLMEASIGRGGSTLIRLGEELDYIQLYTELMKLKYNEKLTVHYEVPESLRQAEAIKFMLQPIVENAIQHGIDQHRERGVITIRVRAAEGTLTVEVHDNGAGIGADKLQELQDRLRNSDGGSASGRIGLQNVHERIRLQYGERFGLTVASEPSGGTTVSCLLPLILIKEGTDHDA